MSSADFLVIQNNNSNNDNNGDFMQLILKSNFRCLLCYPTKNIILGKEMKQSIVHYKIANTFQDQMGFYEKLIYTDYARTINCMTIQYLLIETLHSRIRVTPRNLHAHFDIIISGRLASGIADKRILKDSKRK